MTFPKIAARFLFSLGIILLVAQQSSRAVLASDALKFFNNFFVTGDYVVGGVGLWNTGSGAIGMSLPPGAEGAEPLAAFLYWQVATSANPTAVDVNAGATFNDLPLNTPLGTQLLPTSQGAAAGTQACQLNGGTSRTVHTFRSDILRFLDVDPATGRRVINKVGGYPVALTNNGTTRTLGASVVVIYRHPNPEWPLNAIVMYDGTFVKQQPATLSQRIEGFYDPANVQGRITYIAGSAQGSLGERLSGPFTTRSNAFVGGSGNAWDNVSVTTNALSGATYFDTALAPQSTGPLGFLVNDCIAMGAMIYRTQVNDTEVGGGDGLLDRWEDDDTTTLFDPNGVALPDFRAMGANETVNDVFIEIGAMRTLASVEGTTYGSPEAPLSSTLVSVTDYDGHTHMPTPAALKMLGDAFDAKGIKMHFDVGTPDVYRNPSDPTATVADNYVIGAGGSSGTNPALARGGELIDETACEPVPGTPTSPEVDCQFPDYPGTVSWKSGFMLYKEALFDANRKDSFRYALYAHAKAAPKSLIPCLSGGGGTSVFDENNDCAFGSNPLFHVPGGVSGSGEYPGGDFLVTLGLWDNVRFTGSDFVVATTSMHEFGHTVDLGHGGTALPNCKPNYLSVMNYMFQLGGLVDAEGVPHLGYSESPLLAIDETGVTDGYNVPGLYRTSWYAPKLESDTRTPAKRYCNGQKFDPLLLPVDTVRIDGTVGSGIDWDGVEGAGPQDVNFDGEPDMVDGGPTTTLEGYDDWNNLRLNQVGSRRSFGGISIGPLGVRLLSDGLRLLADGSVLLADGSRLLADGSRFLADGSRLLADGAKFLADGSVLLADGSVLLADGVRLLSDGSRLLSDGSRLLADGSVLLADGARLLADGSVLLADGSVLLADGSQFLADGSVLLADGVKLLSDGSVLLADGSPLLADGAPFAWEFSETTPLTAVESGIIPGPHSLTACVIGGSGVSACLPGPPAEPSDPFHRVWLDWEPPNTGNVARYLVYRVVGDTVIPGSEGTPREVPGTETFMLDTDELPNGPFTYFVEAVLDDEDDTVTPPSNNKTITAENTKPVPNEQAVIGVYEDWLSDVITLTGTDPDSAGLGFNLVAFPTNGSLTGAVPTVRYTSATNYNGPDGFTFEVSETSTWNGLNQESDPPPAAVSFTVTPVNDKPSFTKGPNQTVIVNAGAQTVGGWATGFDAGPPDEDLSQGVLDYIVSNNNNGLFSVQPAIAADGTLTYAPNPLAVGLPMTATVTVQVVDNGGTLEGHGAVDTSDPQTFAITVNPVPATLFTFQRTDVWMSTSSANRKFDLKAEVLRNGVPVLEKVLTNTTLGFGTTFSKAIYKQISPFPTTSWGFTPADKLSVRVSIKVSNSSQGGNNASGAIRIWYDIPSPPGNNSHLHAKKAGTDAKYYLVTPFRLQRDGAVFGPTQSISAIVYKTAYTVLGTWEITGP